MSTLSFQGETFYIGIDVHKSNWKVSIRNNRMELKTFAMDPSPDQLAVYLKKHYPDATYHSVYEAGFSGFEPHRHLCRLGIDNIVIHPADVATTHKEKLTKTDKVDARKLAAELEAHRLVPIYVPEPAAQQIRSMLRLYRRLTKQRGREKNRIKGCLLYYNIAIPEHFGPRCWSKVFRNWVQSLEFEHPGGKEYLEITLDELKSTENQLLRITRFCRNYANQKPQLTIIKRLKTVPGIGFWTSLVFYTEIIDMNRFPNFDRLASYVGLAPTMHASDETEQRGRITPRRNPYLRHLIIEAAWIAVRKDPAMTLAFNRLQQKMPRNRAIIRIAKKLLHRMRAVWRSGDDYTLAKRN